MCEQYSLDGTDGHEVRMKPNRRPARLTVVTPRFAIDPGEVSATASIWRSQEHAVRAIPFDHAADLPVSSSRVATALRATAAPAALAMTVIAARLGSITLFVTGFRDRVLDDDASVAHALGREGGQK